MAGGDAYFVGPGPGPAQRPRLGLPLFCLPLGCDFCTMKGLMPTSAMYPPALPPGPRCFADLSSTSPFAS